MTTRRHPRKIVSTEELESRLLPLKNILNQADEISLLEEYYTNEELKALNTITSKTTHLINKIEARMTEVLNKVNITEARKEKLRVAKAKLAALSDEELDKLLTA